MGIYGSALDVSKLGKNDFNLSFLNYDTSIQAMYSGIDWLYTYVETLYIYDYKVIYFYLLNSVYDESIDFFFLSVWYSSLQTSSLQLFLSVLLDNYITSNLFQFSLTDEWVRGFMSSKDSALFVIYHPEIIFFKSQHLFLKIQIRNLFMEILLISTKQKYPYLKIQDKEVINFQFCFYQQPFYLF